LILRRDVDERLLAKARREGRVRGITLELWARVGENPDRAASTLSQGLRAARALHSRERRFVADALHDLVRYHRLLPEGAAAWDAWLDHLEGGDQLETAAAELSGPLGVAKLFGVPDSVGEHFATLPNWQKVLAQSNGRAPVTVRANVARISRDALAKQLRHLDPEPTESPWGLRLAKRPDLRGLPAAREGLFEVQDEASQRFVALPEPAETVLDYCAGAGGKSLALAARWPSAKILATDVRSFALENLRKRAKRARARVKTRVLPAELPVAELVVVDAPCTGAGVLRRDPTLRYRMDRLPELTAVQAEILRSAADQVAPGGQLLYGTCSILSAENRNQVDAFLADRPEFQLEKELALYPTQDGPDGFYGALLRRST